MLLEMTRINGERIAAIFPCISADGDFYDAAVITVTENNGKVESWNFHRVNRAGNSTLGIVPTFTTFPAAIRAARQSQGWG